MPVSNSPTKGSIVENFLATQGLELSHKEAGNPLAIVALPRQEDLSRAVGSEEKHATLLYLGDDVSSDIVDLVYGAVQECVRVTSLAPFTETISSITSLGDDGARVWMLDSDSGLRRIRERLLRQSAIRSLYDMQEQHANYIPHVTIGYPAEGQTTLSDFEETQARIVKRITFDRIALWNGDDHDLVWRFTDQGEDSEAAYHADLVDNFLAHLKKTTGSGEFIEANVKRDAKGRFATKAERADAEWMTEENLVELGLELYALAQPLVLERYPDLLAQLNSAKSLDEMEPIVEALDKAFAEVGNELARTRAVSPSGQYRMQFTNAAFGNPLHYKIVRNDASHREDMVDDFLAHFGVKGMKWGVRKDVNLAGATTVDFDQRAAVVTFGGKAGTSAESKIKPSDADHKAAAVATQKVRDALVSPKTGPTRPGGPIAKLNESYSKSLQKDDSAKNYIKYENDLKKILEDSAKSYAPKGTTALVTVSPMYITLYVGAPAIISQVAKDIKHSETYGMTRVGLIRDSNGLVTGLTDEPVAQHSELDNFLAHFGVKGMKWGIRKTDSTTGSRPKLSETTAGASRASREAAKARVKAGTGTLRDAHIASLKTAGRRVTNSVLGDKQYWKREAQIAGLVAAGIGLTALAPAVLPAGIISAVSLAYGGTAGTAGFTSLGMTISLGAGYLASVGAGVTNLGRAIRGNARIDNSYARLGARAKQKQTAGDKRTRKILNQSGSISIKNLKHADSSQQTIGDVYKNVSNKEMFDLIVGAAIDDVDISEVPGVVDAYVDMSDDERNLIHFIVGSSIVTEDELEHSELLDDFLAHYGIKGMRWGIRRQRGPGGTVSSGTKTTEDDQPGGSGGKSGGGRGGKDHLSADAERLVATTGKKPHEMSNKEIKEANSRAEAIKKYNELFGPNPNKELEQKVAALRLERDYQKLKAELKAMHPSLLSRVSRLVTKSAPKFKDAYDYLNADANEHTRRRLTKLLEDALKGTNTKRSKKNRSTYSTPSYGAPTSGATNVTVTDVSVNRNEPVHNITSLPPANDYPVLMP